MRTLAAYNGEECLRLMRESPPDCVLLDIMMPRVDGMEVCRRIREDEALRDTPVIFITARASREGLIAGLGAGADDYITKPVDVEETLARVRTQLRIRENHRLNLDLQARLAETRQTAAIGAITEGLAHNLTNLLGVVVGYLDLLQTAPSDAQRVMRCASSMSQAVQRMVTIVRQLTQLASYETLRRAMIPLGTLVEEAVQRTRSELGVPLAGLRLEIGDPGRRIPANAEVFEDALGRLLRNAWESYPEDRPDLERGILLEVEDLPEEDLLEIRIRDRGMGLDPSIAAHAFDPFVSRHTSLGRGMGLTIARHGIRSLQGEIGLRPHPEGGAEAWIRMPLAEEPPLPLTLP